MTDTAPRLDRTAIERLQRVGGDKLVRGMIDLFLEHTPARIRSAREGAAAGDHDAVRRAAHSMKSTAGNLGAAALQEIATRVEHLAAAGDASCGPLIDSIEEEYNIVRGLLEREREGLGT